MSSLDLENDEAGVVSPVEPQQVILNFDDTPWLNPHNWSQTRKILILSAQFLSIVSSTNGTSLASGGVKSTLETFDVHYHQAWTVLPTSIYLVGYVIGNVVLSPLSEMYGRRLINISSTFLSIILLMATAIAPSWPTFIVFRLFSGFFAAGPPSTVSGICADLYGGPINRGRGVLSFNIAGNIGPVLGPIVSGYSVQISWRLSFYIGMALAGVCFLLLLWVPETNHSVILDRHFNHLRTTGQIGAKSGIRSPRQAINWKDVITKVLIRPISMLLTEPLVASTCLYLAFLYAVFYMFLQSYPIVFEGIYGFSSGQEGLVFLAFGLGVLLALPVQYAFETVYIRAKADGKTWTFHHGAKRLPTAFISGPLIVMSLFWSAWTSRVDVHWISPTLSSILYGLGYTLNFNSLLNYMIDSYASYASSANAASSFSRQMLGASLPFAVVPMYRSLGVAWASSLFGFVAAAMSLIPFGFWFYGERILQKSKLAQQLAEEEHQKEVENA